VAGLVEVLRDVWIDVARRSLMRRSGIWRWGTVAVAGMVALLAAGCGGDDDSSGGSPGASTAQRALTVFADESLSEAFTDIGNAFVSQYPDVIPKFTFGMSNALAEQIIDGTAAGTFASSAVADVEKLTAASIDATTPVPFASNAMTIVVPAGNPANVRRLEDLTKPDVKVVLCVAQSACGQHSTQLLAAAGLTVTPTQEAANAGAAVDVVLSGAADAGIVFVSDVLPNGGADTVLIPPDRNLDVRYVIASISSDPNNDIGQAFIDYVTGEDGQALLAQSNFGPP
jgi:molybdate transport system substrate-binding protein